MRIFALLLVLFISHRARADERQECQLALVEDSFGKNELVTSDGNLTELAAEQALQPGDLLRTGLESWVDIRLCDGTGLRIGESSKFYYEGADNERESFVSWAFRLTEGTLRAVVVGDGKGERVKLRVKTGSASMGVRGTEFVVDAKAEGDQETSLHTLEGEVLMGSTDDFDKLGQLRGKELDSGFESVGKERMSLIRKGEAKPLRAALFKSWEYRAERKNMFKKVLERRGWTEIRARFQKAHERLKARRQERALFDRPREKLEERMVERRQEKERKRQENTLRKFQEPIQESGHEATREGRQVRRKQLQEQMDKNESETNNKRLHKGWRKRLQNQQPTSPRQLDPSRR